MNHFAPFADVCDGALDDENVYFENTGNGLLDKILVWAHVVVPSFLRSISFSIGHILKGVCLTKWLAWYVVALDFMTCWISLWSFVILRRIHLVGTRPRNFELLCMFLLYFSDTISKLIYAGMNPVCKRKFRTILSCKRKRNVGVVYGVETPSPFTQAENVETHSTALQRSWTWKQNASALTDSALSEGS